MIDHPGGAVGVCVVDGRPLVAEGLAAVLAADGSIEVLGVASDEDGAAALLARGDVQVAVVGVEEAAGGRHRRLVARTAAAAASSGVPVVGVVSGGRDAADDAGADLLTVVAAGSTVDALRGAVLGCAPGRGAGIPLRMVRAPQPAAAEPSRGALLTVREREVLRGIESGMSTREIAADLGITVNTARTHAQRLLSKLGVHSRLRAAAISADGPHAGRPDRVAT